MVFFYVGSIFNELSKCNTRSTLQEFLNYVKIINNNYGVLWDEYTRKKWSRQRLKTYSGKKSVFDNFFNSLKDNSGRRVVIAYGDAGFASSSKYETAAPTTRVLTEAKKHFRVIMVDEFRTTQVHSETGKRLSQVIESSIIDGERNLKTVRGLLWCNSTMESKFVNRDFDAAKSIVQCYNLYPERPLGLGRDEKTQDKPHAKYITRITEGVEDPVSEIQNVSEEQILPFLTVRFLTSI